DRCVDCSAGVNQTTLEIECGRRGNGATGHREGACGLGVTAAAADAERVVSQIDNPRRSYRSSELQGAASYSFDCPTIIESAAAIAAEQKNAAISGPHHTLIDQTISVTRIDV